MSRSTIMNFDRGAPTPPAMSLAPRGYPHGAQIVKLDEDGNALDAHSDFITYFGDSYYLYGESYGCSYGVFPNPPQGPKDFCGFRVYQSDDLVHWESRGKFIDPATSEFARENCATTNACFGPVVVYNPTTDKYVLWFHRAIGEPTTTPLVALEGETPLGPWKNPTYPAVPTGFAPDIFVDKDGSAYVSYSVGEFGLSVQKLNESYTDVAGSATTVTRPSGGTTDPECVPPGGTSSPEYVYQTPVSLASWRGCGLAEVSSVFRQGNRYFMTFSDPICAFCLGTATSYFVADSPLGPWRGQGGTPSFDPDNPGKFDGYPLSSDSCGGQPFHVTDLPTAEGGQVHVYTSVLWANSVSEGAANHLWEPLRFRDGLIRPLRCGNPTVPLAEAVPQKPAPPKALNICAAGSGNSLSQTLTAPATGQLRTVELSLYKGTRPRNVFGREGLVSAPLEIELAKEVPGSRDRAVQVLQAEDVSWAPTRTRLEFPVDVRRGDRLTLSLSSASEEGCYATLYEAHGHYAAGRLSGKGGIQEPAVPNSDLATPSSDLLLSATVDTPRGELKFGSWQIIGD